MLQSCRLLQAAADLCEIFTGEDVPTVPLGASDVNRLRIV